MKEYTRIRYKLLQVRQKEFNKFIEVYEEIKVIHPNLTKVDFFKLIVNYYVFNEQDNIRQEIAQKEINKTGGIFENV